MTSPPSHFLLVRGQPEPWPPTMEGAPVFVLRALLPGQSATAASSVPSAGQITIVCNDSGYGACSGTAPVVPGLHQAGLIHGGSPFRDAWIFHGHDHSPLFRDTDLLFFAGPVGAQGAGPARYVPPPGRRTLCLAAMGWVGSSWWDGPLADLGAGGDFKNLIPAGGHAALQVPIRLDPVESRADMAQSHLDFESLRTDRSAWLSALTAVAARMGSVGADSSATPDRLTIGIGAFNAATAVGLIMIRQVRPQTRIVIHAASGEHAAGNVPPAFRRFMQNTGLESPVRTAPGDMPDLWLEDIGSPWMSEVPRLVRYINRKSDVMPRRMQNEVIATCPAN